jgi:phosphoethanolamine N-methyltransferase
MVAEELYDSTHIAFLEAIWGEGYLSPGGPEEVARVLHGLDIAGMEVLDIGCGAGGITAALVRDYGARHVTGIDVEPGPCAAARALAERRSLTDRMSVIQVTPGPLPFTEAAFDLVFSKDSIVHIADKETLCADVYRVLAPGGWFAASDWLTSRDGGPSAEMAYYLACEDLGFGMASPARYEAALRRAGFVEIALVNRNDWYRVEARRELARVETEERARFEAILGPDEVARQIATWKAMLPVLDSGEHCPHHIRARKPL